MNVLALIPARGGSKGIPRKNIASCGGRPLIAWTCLAAREATCLSRTIVSTDDREIADIAVAHGVQAPFLRRAELATDTARSIDVANDALDWLEREERWRADVLVLLQPTSPLRTGRHIDEAFALLRPDLDSVVSVVEVPHRYKPWAILELVRTAPAFGGAAGGAQVPAVDRTAPAFGGAAGGAQVPAVDDRLLRHAHQGELPFDRHRRQGQPALYTRNGPAVVVTQVRTIRGGSHYGERSAPYVMSQAESIDIDEPYDLELADWALRRRG
jgi:CMP-N-acetylneuraminic acid synthetase